MSPWPAVRTFSRADRLSALRLAADVLISRQPCFQSSCRVWIDPNWLDAHAEWRWPGVVRVSLRHTGQLIAESKPGQPYRLADNKGRT